MPRDTQRVKILNKSSLSSKQNDAASLTTTSLRRSPRKNGAVAPSSENAAQSNNDVLILTATATQSRLSPTKKPPTKHSPTKSVTEKPIAKPRLLNIPILPRGLSELPNEARSYNRSSPSQYRRPLYDNEEDALIQPLSQISLDSKTSQSKISKSSKDPGETSEDLGSRLLSRSPQQNSIRTSPRKNKVIPRNAGQFVLKEARCNDDDEDSEADESEDEDTDLSGFIVDDDAELSYQDSSDADSDVEFVGVKKKNDSAAPRRRLQRGSRTAANEHLEDAHSDLYEHKHPSNDLLNKFQNLKVEADEQKDKDRSANTVIDLTSSPAKSTQPELDGQLEDSDNPFSPIYKASRVKGNDVAALNSFDDLATLRFSPPRSYSPAKIPKKSEFSESIFTIKPDEQVSDVEEHPRDRFTTPPATPPRSPSKLKSPSKLLSPSKRGNDILRSPHRQSMDAFWDLNTINEWTDQYSPKKEPIGSPKKYRFWSDSEDENKDFSNDSSDSLPSPCTSPRKSHSRSQSPSKSPEKLLKQRLAEEKRAAVAAKKSFDSRKEKLATDLLTELDDKLTTSQLKKLAASTGGVQVVWSKTLRSTAGRANWRRTITKPSGSPVKSSTVEVPGVIVRHFANIELAEKIIDSEERLVNTLAHEFCHLANFMISGVRDQPHGSSFKSWAMKVTKHLRASNNPIWKQVEVTTKHNYVINHKYLWICAGRETTKAMEFLNLDDDEGCGAEYGRHSKSIDSEKHRCGRCKGKLIQVRPKPRASPVKKNNVKANTEAVNGGGSLEKLIEVIELDDD